jgi:4-amino-4-deoxy-L-arabinose transferase-like glycosyltransferase
MVAEARPSNEGRSWSQRAAAFAKSTEFRWLLVVLVLSAAFRMTWDVYADRLPAGLNDPVVYYTIGHRIADGQGYTRPPQPGTEGNPDGWPAVPFAYYPVGYPFSLGVIFWTLEHTPGPDDYVLAAKVMNGVYGLLTTLLVYVMGRRLFGPPVGLVAGFLHAAFPSQILYTGTILSEPLFTFLVMLALTVLLWRFPQRDDRGIPWLQLVAGGLLLGAATLTRGITLFLPLLFFFLWWASSRRPGMAALHAGILLAGILAFAVPWSIRNTVQMNSFVFISTNVGDDLCIGHHEGAPGTFTLTGPCFDPYPRKYFDTTSPDVAEVEKNREGTRRAISYAVRHPWNEVKLIGWKFWYLMAEDRDGTYASESYNNDLFLESGMREGLNFWANLYYYGVLAWAVLSAPVAFLSRDLRRAALGLSLLYLLAMPVIFFGDPRFHYPAVPLITIVAATGIVAIAQAARKQLRQPTTVSQLEPAPS